MECVDELARLLRHLELLNVMEFHAYLHDVKADNCHSDPRWFAGCAGELNDLNELRMCLTAEAVEQLAKVEKEIFALINGTEEHHAKGISDPERQGR